MTRKPQGFRSFSKVCSIDSVLQASLASDCSRLRAEGQRLNTRMAEKDQALADAQSDCEHTTTVLAQTREELRICRDSECALQRAMCRMETDVAQTREAAASAAANCEDLQKTLQEQSERAMDHEVRVTAQQQATRCAQERVAALQEQLAEAQQKAQASENRASNACSTAIAAQEQLNALQLALKDTEKTVLESNARATEAQQTAAAAVADLTALRQLHSELGLLHGDNGCGRVSSEDLADLKRELQSLQCVSHDLHASSSRLHEL